MVLCFISTSPAMVSCSFSRTSWLLGRMSATAPTNGSRKTSASPVVSIMAPWGSSAPATRSTRSTPAENWTRAEPTTLRTFALAGCSAVTAPVGATGAATTATRVASALATAVPATATADPPATVGLMMASWPVSRFWPSETKAPSLPRWRTLARPRMSWNSVSFGVTPIVAFSPPLCTFRIEMDECGVSNTMWVSLWSCGVSTSSCPALTVKWLCELEGSSWRDAPAVKGSC